MILSILATVAVLAAIAVIAAALVFAETVLVYIALGLAGVSVLLLLGSAIQGRLVESRTGRPGTDGLGKSSVPTGAAMTAATATGPHVEPEHAGRVPVPAHGPVREAPADTPAWTAPVADDPGHGEPEYDVPRWQTPTAHEWPEPDTAPQVPDETTARWDTPAEDGGAGPASEEWTFGRPGSGAQDTVEVSEVPDRTGEDEKAASPVGPLDAEYGEPESAAAPFSYSIPGQASSPEDGPALAAAVADSDEDVPADETPDTGAFAYRIPRDGDGTDPADDDAEPSEHDTGAGAAMHPTEDDEGVRADDVVTAETVPVVEHSETGADRDEDDSAAPVAPVSGSGAEPAVTADGTADDAPDTGADGTGEPVEEWEHAFSGADRASSAGTDTDADADADAVTDADTAVRIDTDVRADANDTGSEAAQEPDEDYEDTLVSAAVTEDTEGADAVVAESGVPDDDAPAVGASDGDASEDAPGFAYRVPDRSEDADEEPEEVGGAGDGAQAEDTGRTSAFTYRLPQPEDGGAVAERVDRDGEDGVPVGGAVADASDPDATAVFVRPGPQDDGDGADGPTGGATDGKPAVRPEEAGDDHAVSSEAVLDGDGDLDDDKDSDRVH